MLKLAKLYLSWGWGNPFFLPPSLAEECVSPSVFALQAEPLDQQNISDEGEGHRSKVKVTKIKVVKIRVFSPVSEKVSQG